MAISGLIWIGPLLDRGGYGNVSRNFVRGLVEIGFPVRTYSMGPAHEELEPDHVALIRRLADADVGPRPAAVVNTQPEWLDRLALRGMARTACCSIFETDRLPAGWPRRFRRFDEVWVPGAFNQRTYAASGVPAERLVTIPYGMDTEYFSPARRRGAARPFPGFVFLYCFAFGWRKGFDLLLRAYREEFSAHDDVTLVLKVYPSQGAARETLRPTMEAIFREDSARDPATLPRLVVQDEPVSPAALRDLYAACDCYVSTDRANGWGMPCFECMAMGVPCATVDWSGSTEFMHADTALLIRPEPELEPVDPRLVAWAPSLYAGHRWPVVRIAEVRRVLRRAYELRGAELDALGARGGQAVQQRFSLAAAARRIAEHLGRVEGADLTRPLRPHVGPRRGLALLRRAARRLIAPLHRRRE